MTTVALGSVKGAPGVTTTVLAMAAIWPPHRRLVVAELDPDGGVLAARRNLTFDPGLVSAVAALRGARGVGDHLQPLGEGVRALVAPSTTEQVRAAVTAAGDALLPALTDVGDDVLVDAGRLGTTSPTLAIASAADVLLLLARPRVEDIVLVRDRVQVLQRSGAEPQLVLVDDGPYRSDEVAGAVGAPVLTRLPVDLRTADALNGRTPRHRVARSRLLRSASALVSGLLPEEPRTNGSLSVGQP